MQQPDVNDKRNVVQIAPGLRRGLFFQLLPKKKVGVVGGGGVVASMGVGVWGGGCVVLCWAVGLRSGEERDKALGCSKRRQRKGKEKKHT